MIRKAAIALLTLISCLSSQVYALGLGRVTVESALNQPLRARIEILQLADTRPEDINAQLASFDDFQRFNVERVGYLSDIRFRVVTDANGPYVSVTSNQLVQEPYLNFILDTRWPNGRLLSEHTLLFDLPVFNDEETIEPVEVASRGSISANAVPVGNTAQAASLEVTPADAEPSVQTIRRLDEPVITPSDAPDATNTPADAAVDESAESASDENDQPAGTSTETPAASSSDNQATAEVVEDSPQAQASTQEEAAAEPVDVLVATETDELTATTDSAESMGLIGVDEALDSAELEEAGASAEPSNEVDAEESTPTEEQADEAEEAIAEESSAEEGIDDPQEEESADTEVATAPESAAAGLASSPGAEPVAESVEQEPVMPSQQNAVQEDTQPAENELLTTDSDTLWSIALRSRPSRDVSVQQTMIALQRANSDAFIGGNINRLRSGQVLRIPDLTNMRSVDQREAVAEVARQNAQADLGPAPLTALSQSQTSSSNQPRGELSVVTAEDANVGGQQGGSATAELDARIASLENLLMQAQEESDRARMQREELRDQLTQLDQQIGSAQELIRLQDLQLAQLQASLAEQVNTTLAGATDPTTDAPADTEVSPAETEVEQSSQTIDSGANEAELSAEQNAALQAELQEAGASATRPTSLLGDLSRILTGNMAFTGFAVVLVILLLVVILLRRSRASRLDEDDEPLEVSAAAPAPEPENSDEGSDDTLPVTDDGDADKEALDELLGLEEVIEDEFLPPEIGGVSIANLSDDDMSALTEVSDEFDYSQGGLESTDSLEYTLPIGDDEDQEEEVTERDAEPKPESQDMTAADQSAGSDEVNVEVDFDSAVDSAASDVSASTMQVDAEAASLALDSEDTAAEEEEESPADVAEVDLEERFAGDEADEGVQADESVEFDLDDLDSFDDSVSFDEAFSDENTVEIENVESSLEDSEKLETEFSKDVAQATLDIENPIDSNGLDLEFEEVSDSSEGGDEADTDLPSGAIDELEIEAFDLDDFDLDAIAAEEPSNSQEPAGEAVESIDFDIAAPENDAAVTALEEEGELPASDETLELETFDFDLDEAAAPEAEATNESGEAEEELETFEFEIEEPADASVASRTSESAPPETSTDEELETFDFDTEEAPAADSLHNGEDSAGVAEDELEVFDFDISDEASSTAAGDPNHDGAAGDAIDFDSLEDSDEQNATDIGLDDEGFLDLDELVEAADRHEQEKGSGLPGAVQLDDSDVDFDLDFDSDAADTQPEANDEASEVEGEADSNALEFDVEDEPEKPGAPELSASDDSNNLLAEEVSIPVKADSGSDLDFELDDEIIDSGSGDSVELLGGADEVDTKLELAYAYQKMGDPEGAREILEEVLAEGNKQQKAEAQKLLDAS